MGSYDAVLPRSRSALGLAHDLVALTRPRQWVKNLLVLAAPGAAGILGHADALLHVLLACALFCLLSAATYAVNDVLDRDEDALHPVKCRRPVASGALPVRAALRLAAVAALIGVSGSFLIGPWSGAIAVAYLLLTAGYALRLRGVAYLDVAVVATGFVLRALAGGAAVHIHVSRAFLVVCCACALLVAAGKRLGELRARQGTRAVLRHYSVNRLRILGIAATAVAVAAYGVWAAGRPEPAHAPPYNALSAIPFVAWLLRYGFLARGGQGEAPEELVTHDRVLLLLGAVWVLVFAAGVHATR